MAAQMLAGKGFDPVYNLSGGIKGWQSQTAFGPEDMGLALFTGNESVEESLVVAYSLEAGLYDFYSSMAPKVRTASAQALFRQLSGIEIKHQDRIFNAYTKVSGRKVARDVFEDTVVTKAAEGGLTTEEYLTLFQPDMESVREITSLAMSIEAQALDLYQRAADKAANLEIKEALHQIADEEKIHLSLLSKLMEQQ